MRKNRLYEKKQSHFTIYRTNSAEQLICRELRMKHKTALQKTHHYVWTKVNFFINFVKVDTWICMLEMVLYRVSFDILALIEWKRVFFVACNATQKKITTRNCWVRSPYLILKWIEISLKPLIKTNYARNMKTKLKIRTWMSNLLIKRVTHQNKICFRLCFAMNNCYINYSIMQCWLEH